MTRWRAWSVASSAVAALTAGIYVVVLSTESTDSVWEVFPWALLIVVGGAASVWSSLTGDAVVGRNLATAAVVILGVVGALAIFTVALASCWRPAWPVLRL